MIFENIKLVKSLFGQLSLSKYVSEQNVAPLVRVDLPVYGEVEKKVVKDPSHNVTLNLTESFSPELDDFGRLHWLVNTRHVTTILEFGLGESTTVFNDTLSKNKLRDQNLIQGNLRRNNLYECHSIDNYQQWIDEVKSKHSLDRVTYHKSELIMGEFQGRVCTYYDPMLNLCPDFIYLDGPDQTSPVGSVRGITTSHKDRMPMSADILSIEYFLVPGTLIVTDGRTEGNLQRN